MSKLTRATPVVSARPLILPYKGQTLRVPEGFTAAPFAIGLAAYVIAGSLVDLIERTQIFRARFTTSLQRARGLPRSHPRL